MAFLATFSNIYATETIHITCNTCTDAGQAYGKMYSHAGSNVTASGYTADYYVANFTTGVSYGWHARSSYYFNGEDGPEVRITSYAINVPSNLLTIVSGVKTNYGLMQNIIVYDPRWPSAWDVAPYVAEYDDVSNWVLSQPSISSYMQMAISLTVGTMWDAFRDMKIKLFFSDGSSILMKSSRINPLCQDSCRVI